MVWCGTSRTFRSFIVCLDTNTYDIDIHIHIHIYEIIVRRAKHLSGRLTSISPAADATIPLDKKEALFWALFLRPLAFLPLSLLTVPWPLDAEAAAGASRVVATSGEGRVEDGGIGLS